MTITVKGESPLARAVRTKSEASTASMEARVMRAIGRQREDAECQGRQHELLQAGGEAPPSRRATTLSMR